MAASDKGLYKGQKRGKTNKKSKDDVGERGRKKEI